MEFVKITHPAVDGEGECALSALHLWEGLGWRRVDNAPQEVIDLSQSDEKPAEPDRAPEPPTSSKASRRGVSNEE